MGFPVQIRRTARAGRTVRLEVSREFDGEPFDELFARLLDTIDTAAVTHLIFGYWGATYEKNMADPVVLLVDAVR